MREIEVLLDQPSVGENLSDHPATQLIWTTPEPVSLLRALEPETLAEYEASGTGPFASNFAESGGFVRVDPDAPAPDIQFHFVPLQIIDEGQRDPEMHGFFASACLLTERSRGNVRLASADPTAKPIVYNEFYDEPDDLERIVAGHRLLQDIVAQDAMSPYAVEPYNVPDGDSDQAQRAHVAATTFAIYHPVGTCRMGTDAAAVVDPELHVNGLEGIRVVDASSMRYVTNGNIYAPTMMLAEKSADLIMGNTPLAPLHEPFYRHVKADGTAMTDGRAAAGNGAAAEAESASASAESPTAEV
jgi:choline dehydrogenase